MSDSRTQTGAPAESSRSRLPDRITGIVFWGLVLVGIASAAYNIHQYETSLYDHIHADAYKLSQQVQTLLTQTPNADRQQLRTGLGSALRELNALAVRISNADTAIVIGDTASASGSDSLNFPGRLQDAPVDITVYPQPPTDRIAEHRKVVLGITGLTLAAFGLLLNWILRRLISQPFEKMIHAAVQFRDGDTEQRFDQRRDDEFGFLARFINQALDELMDKHAALGASLQREQQSDLALQEEKERLQVTLNSIADGVVTTDKASCIVYMNPVAEKLTGHQLRDVQGLPLHEVLTITQEITGEPLELPVTRCVRDGTSVQSEGSQILTGRSGRETHIENSAAPIRDLNNDIIGAVMVIQDVGDARKLTRELSYQATHDPLTGLCNRREFEAQLQSAIDSAHHYENLEHVLCYMDLDQFKIVNDTCGHAAGDELLRQLGSLLREQLRESDLLARLGGDEFGLLLHNCPVTKARGLAEGVREAVNEFRFVWQGKTFEIGASIGLVAITADSHDLNEVMSTADMACYTAKDDGRNRIVVHTADNRHIRQRKTEMQTVAIIKRALHEDSFELYAQTILQLDNDTTNHLELLLRLRDPDGEIRAPGAFMPAAERYNAVVDIDRWVVNDVFDRQATAIAHSLAATAEPASPSTLAINLSGKSLTEEDFSQQLAELLDSTAIPPQSVCFEIIETAAISNPNTAKEFILRFKEFGCRFALDDFGSGMSSFAYLKHLPVDFLKIDGSYVQDIVQDPVDLALVRSVNQIGQVLGMQTIAEFVEDAAILAELRSIGVDYAQGYHIARPAPLRDWLAATTSQDRKSSANR